MISHEKAQKLLKDATSGPWKVYDRGVGYHIIQLNGWRLPEGTRTDIARREDAELLAAAPELAATVIALYERLGHSLAGSEESGIPAHVKQVLTGQEP